MGASRDAQIMRLDGTTMTLKTVVTMMCYHDINDSEVLHAESVLGTEADGSCMA